MIGAAGAAAVLLSIGLLWVRRFDMGVWLCAVQAVFAAMLLGEVSVAIALLASQRRRAAGGDRSHE